MRVAGNASPACVRAFLLLPRVAPSDVASERCTGKARLPNAFVQRKLSSSVSSSETPSGGGAGTLCSSDIPLSFVTKVFYAFNYQAGCVKKRMRKEIIWRRISLWKVFLTVSSFGNRGSWYPKDSLSFPDRCFECQGLRLLRYKFMKIFKNPCIHFLMCFWYVWELPWKLVGTRNRDEWMDRENDG